MAQAARQTVLVMSFGPVQDFIEKSRRCRDLAYSSWLLGELVRTAAAAARTAGAELVFPSPNAVDAHQEVANKLLCRVPGADAPTVASAAATAARARLTAIAAPIFQELTRRAGPVFHHDAAKRQVADLLEVAWAVGEGPDYAAARQAAEALLAARKNTRLFGPNPAAAEVPKSALDGERESVIDESAFDDWDAAQLHSVFGVRRKERLCGVGLLKRLGRKQADWSFHSTGHVAALPVLDGLPDAAGYIAALRELGIPDEELFSHVAGQSAFLDGGRGVDAGWLIEERLEEWIRDHEPPQAAAAAARRARTALRVHPSPYFAVLVADGDRMGERIDAAPTPEAHLRLGEQLSAFAAEARALAKREGSLLYAGGDDVLMLLPLDRCVRVARELADRFATTVGGSLSVGLGVGHHREDLGDTLQLAREAERLAKRERNSLGIVAWKRGGAPLMIAGRWDADPPIDARIHAWTAMLAAGALPEGFGHALRDAMLRIPRKWKDSPPGLPTAATVARAELRRLLEQKAVEAQGTVLERAAAGVPLAELADELILARLLRGA